MRVSERGIHSTKYWKQITSSKSSVTTIDIDTEPVSQEKLVYAGKHRDSPVDMLRQEPPESGSLNSASGQLIKLPYARERMRQQPPDAAQPSNSGTPSSTHQGHCYKGKIIIVNAQNGNSLVGNVGLGGGSHVYENDISITSTTGEHNVQVGNIAQGCGPFSTK
jgi:hypothetical protein